MEQVNARRALELLIDVVEQYGEGTVYEKFVKDSLPMNGSACYYERDGAPSCLVGHVLHRAGVSVEMLANIDIYGTPAGRLATVVPGLNWEAAGVLGRAQRAQDQGQPWGVALEAARAYYENEGGAADAAG